MKLDFIIAGATRSGTTTLHDLLSRNAHIFMPAKKELNYFWKDQNYNQGLKLYQSFFVPAKEDQILGEASPSYLDRGFLEDENGRNYYDLSNDSALRIKKDFPDIKLIFSLRNPVARSYSLHSRAVWGGWEDKDFETAIQEELNGIRTPENNRRCYLIRSLYHESLSHFYNLFPAEQIKIIIFEEWTKETVSTVQELEEFLGAPLQTLNQNDIEVKNQGRSLKKGFMKKLVGIMPKNNILTRAISKRFLTNKGYESITEKAEDMCKAYFAEDRKKLEKLLGRDLTLWK